MSPSKSNKYQMVAAVLKMEYALKIYSKKLSFRRKMIKYLFVEEACYSITLNSF